MAQFFQINIDDVWSGRVAAGHVIRLTEHLTLIQSSRVAAIRQGDMEWVGWDTAAIVGAHTHNLIAMLLAGLSKGIDVKDLWLETPSGEPEDEPEPIAVPTIAEFSAGKFSNFMYGKG